MRPGYWSLVFKRATELIQADKNLDGTTAFHLAKDLTESELDQNDIQLSLGVK